MSEKPENTPRPTLEDYQAMMDGTRAPARLQSDVLKKAEQAREEAAAGIQGAGAGGSSAPDASVDGMPAPAAPPVFAIRRRRFKGLAVAACVALVVGLGALGAAFALPGTVLPSAAPGAGDLPGAASGNFFALAAYADENPEGVPGVTLGLKNFGDGGYSGTEYNQLTFEKYPDGDWITQQFHFDATCTGENVVSITYELVGTDAFFWVYDEEEFLRAHGAYGDDDPAAEAGYHETTEQTFTVDYDEQDLRARRISCTINVPFHLEGEAKELNDRLYQTIPSENADVSALSQSFARAVNFGAGQVLAQTQLKLTATFADGTTETKTYVIAPVENFDQAYEAYAAARDEAMAAPEAEQADAFDRLDPQLYTITELA